jgi:hypothetical protein
MPYRVTKTDVWAGEIDDRPGGLAGKLEPLGDSGADLQFVIARREPHVPGKGVVFVGPVTGAKAKKAAEGAGLKKTADLVALRVEGPNKPGEGGRMMRRLADAGINLRGVSAAVLGDQFVAFLAFDNETDAGNAARLLRSAGAKKK